MAPARRTSRRTCSSSPTPHSSLTNTKCISHSSADSRPIAVSLALRRVRGAIEGTDCAISNERTQPLPTCARSAMMAPSDYGPSRARAAASTLTALPNSRAHRYRCLAGRRGKGRGLARINVDDMDVDLSNFGQCCALAIGGKMGWCLRTGSIPVHLCDSNLCLRFFISFCHRASLTLLFLYASLYLFVCLENSDIEVITDSHPHSSRIRILADVWRMLPYAKADAKMRNVDAKMRKVDAKTLASYANMSHRDSTDVGCGCGCGC